MIRITVKNSEYYLYSRLLFLILYVLIKMLSVIYSGIWILDMRILWLAKVTGGLLAQNAVKASTR